MFNTKKQRVNQAVVVEQSKTAAIPNSSRNFIYSTQRKQQYGLHSRIFVHTNLLQAGFELEYLGPMSVCYQLSYPCSLTITKCKKCSFFNMSPDPIKEQKCLQQRVDFIKVGCTVQIIEIALSICTLCLRPTFEKLFCRVKVGHRAQ